MVRHDARLLVVVECALAFGGWICAAALSLAAEPRPVPLAAPDVGEPQSLDESFRRDAALLDVCFVDRATGWAVGERGVIWHTADGGATWRQQMSPARCRLNSVCFLDARRGWIAGGSSKPHATSHGVLLRTEDAGATWALVPNSIVPAIARVRFFDANLGVAMGDGSSSFPSGVFATRDGGRNWQPLPSDRNGCWSTGDFLELDTGAVAGSAGAFASLVRREVTYSPLAVKSLRSFHALRLAAPTSGWLVGDGGLVMTTTDAGRTWQTPPTDLPDAAGEHFDFHALAVEGANVWIAGSPGTRVFHSPDQGNSWLTFSTGHQPPLRALSFVDAARGWAVGELGSILATADGGRTWKMQRCGARRAALFAVFARPTDVPLELVAEEGASEGYITAVEVLHPVATDAASGVDACDSQRTREAMLSVGASAAETAWGFPLPTDDLAMSPADLLAALNKANDGRAVERLQGHLVRQLRMWRPDVIVTHHDHRETGQPSAALVEQLVLSSIAAAADATQFVGVAADAGLESWQVKRVYGLLPAGSRGNTSVSTGRFFPRLGTTLTDWSAPSRRLLAASPSSADTLELELLVNHTPSTDGPRGMFNGIPLSPGGEARRSLSILPVDNLEELRRSAARGRQMQELLERTQGSATWASQISTLTEGLTPSGGAELLFQLGEGYWDKGRLDLAADTFYLLARRDPDHPLADESLVWLLQFYASSETANRAPDRGATSARPVVKQDDVDERESQATARSSPEENGGLKLVTAVEPIGPNAAPANGLSREERLGRAVQLGEYLEAARPTLFAEPSVGFPLVVAQRQLGFANPAKRYYLKLRSLPESDAWRKCAATEEWLAQPGEAPPTKAIVNCVPTSERPHLDGKLDDALWRNAEVLRLRAAADATAPSPSKIDKAKQPKRLAEVRLAYDQAFMYIAVQCPKAPGIPYAADNRPRPRDADLAQHDRVSLQFDTDRDYQTSFELTLDDRGWTRDSCWGDATWNPNWFVAATADETSWTVEAAIPLAELTAQPPAARHVWALSAGRTIPRAGYETWTGGESEADSPDQFGLLIFN